MTSTDPHQPRPRGHYLRQLTQRRQRQRLRQLVNFGVTVGWALLLLGGLAFVAAAWMPDAIALGMMALGALLLLLAGVCPELLAGLEGPWMRLAHWQGQWVMRLLLWLVYQLAIRPLGRWQQRRHGRHPFYAWSAPAPAGLIGWENLPPTRSAAATPQRARHRSRLTLLAGLVGFFLQRGHYLAAPVLLLLLVMGLLLLFVKSSALAPFIYTLF